MYTKFGALGLLSWLIVIGAEINHTDAIPTNYTMTIPQWNWNQEIILSEELPIKLKIYTNDPQGLVMELRGPSTGTIGIGFSPDGQLEGSDMLIGWRDYFGGVHVRDTHVINGQPMEDLEQNHELLHAQTNQNEDELILLLRRPWDNCEDQNNDLRITNSPQTLVWTYSPESPNDITSSEFSQKNWSGTFQTEIMVPLQARKECRSEFGSGSELEIQRREKRSPRRNNRRRCNCKCCRCNPYCP